MKKMLLVIPLILASLISQASDFIIQVQPSGGKISSFKVYEDDVLFAKQNISSANSGNYIYTSGDHDGSVFTFASNSLADLQPGSGPIVHFNGGFSNAICYFLSADCSGQCHLGLSEGQTGSSSNNLELIQSTVFKAGSSYLKSQASDY